MTQPSVNGKYTIEYTLHTSRVLMDFPSLSTSQNTTSQKAACIMRGFSYSFLLRYHTILQFFMSEELSET